jgi:hypothetical protein
VTQVSPSPLTPRPLSLAASSPLSLPTRTPNCCSHSAPHKSITTTNSNKKEALLHKPALKPPCRSVSLKPNCHASLLSNPSTTQQPQTLKKMVYILIPLPQPLHLAKNPQLHGSRNPILKPSKRQIPHKLQKNYKKNWKKSCRKPKTQNHPEQTKLRNLDVKKALHHRAWEGEVELEAEWKKGKEWSV